MYQTTESYKTAIKQDVRDVCISGRATLKNGSYVDIRDENIVQGSLYINRRCVNGNDIDLGTVYAGEMGVSLLYGEDENPYRYDGAYIDLSFGILTESGNYEYVPLGIFRVAEIKRSRHSVDLVCIDDITKLDITANISSDFAQTAHDPFAWLAWCCTQSGVVCGITTLEGYPNGSRSLSFEPEEGSDYTYRDICQYVLQIIGGFGYIDRLGKFQVGRFHSAADTESTPDDRFSTDLSDYEVSISGFSYSDGENTFTAGSEGYMLSLERNPFMQTMSKEETAACLNLLLKGFSGLTYSICDFEDNGDPALDAGDTILFYSDSREDYFLCSMTYEELEGLTHEQMEHMRYEPLEEGELYQTEVNVIAMNTTWRYRRSCTVNSYGKENDLRSEYDSVKKLTNSIIKITNDIINLNLQDEYLNSCLGGYVWIRLDNQKRNEILIMDNPDPEKAVRIWRWNLAGLGYSSNCVGADNPDRTYEVAITMDGTISGKFIKTGIIQSADGSLQINLNDGEAEIIGRIVASSGAIGNWNISANEIYAQNGSRFTVLKRNGDIAFAAGSTAYNDLADALLKILHSGEMWSDSAASRAVFGSGGVEIYGSGSFGDAKAARELLAKLNSSGYQIYRDGKYLGFIGTNKTAETGLRGIVFDLGYDGDFIGWYYKKDPEDDINTHIMSYFRGEGFRFGEEDFTVGNGNDMNIYRNIDMHNYDLLNADIPSISDARLKKNIKPTDVCGLDVINAMEMISHDWIEDGAHVDIGFIAQQLYEVDPELVGNAQKNGMDIMTIRPMQFIPYLVKAVQELSEQIGAQQRTIEQLCRRLDISADKSKKKPKCSYGKYKKFIKIPPRGEVLNDHNR